MFSLICAWTNGWAGNRDVGDLRRPCAHYEVTVMRYGSLSHTYIPFTSTGRHYEVNDYGEHIYTNPFTPLEFFQVRQGQNYYFRVISAAFTFPFAISIDGHPLHVVAPDGYHFRTEVVDYLIITSGERYDFWIEATNPGGLNRFWLRAETLEQKNGNQVGVLIIWGLNKMTILMPIFSNAYSSNMTSVLVSH